MTLVQKPDLKNKLLILVVLDSFLVAVAAGIYLVSSSILYTLMALILGGALSMPLILNTVRDMKEHSDA